MARTLSTMALIACLVLAAVGVGPAFASDSSSTPEYTQLDEDHILASDEAINEYRDNGSASAELSYPQMELTVAGNRDAVNLSSSFLGTDINSEYLRIDYQEDKERVVRLYLPRDYVRPYTGEVEAEVGDAPAELEPVRNREYLSVTVHLSGEADTYVYQLSKLDGFSEDVRAGWADRLNPFQSDSEVVPEAEEWQYVSAEDIGDSYAIEVRTVENRDYRVQYHAGDEDWRTIPHSETEGEPYYVHVRDGVDDEVTVIPTSNETPQVRYKSDKSITESASDLGSGLTDIVDSLREDLFSLFSG